MLRAHFSQQTMKRLLLKSISTLVVFFGLIGCGTENQRVTEETKQDSQPEAPAATPIAQESEAPSGSAPSPEEEAQLNKLLGKAPGSVKWTKIREGKAPPGVTPQMPGASNGIPPSPEASPTPNPVAPSVVITPGVPSTAPGPAITVVPAAKAPTKNAGSFTRLSKDEAPLGVPKPLSSD